MPSMADIRAGGAFVELYTKNSRLYKGLRAARYHLNGWSKQTTAAGLRMIGLGASMAAPFGLAVKAASQTEETMNKFNVVFGENRKAIKAWGDEYGKQVGRSKQQVADFLASSQDLFMPMGFAADAAEGMSKQVTQLSVDLASFNNKADADVLRDLHAALTGSGEVMKKYGVILSMAAVKQELLNQGMDPKKATEQEKAQARLAIIMRGTTAAQGDAVRSAGSWANQQKRLGAVLHDTASAIGGALLPVVTPLLTKVADTVGMIGRWVQENQGLVVSAFKIALAVAAAGAALVALGTTLGLLGAAAGGITALMTLFSTVIGGVLTAVGFLLSPIGALTVLLAGLAGYLIYTSGVLGWLGEQFGALKDFASDALGGIKDALAAGDFELAAKLLWAAMRVQWVGGINWLMGKWADFKTWFLTGWTTTVYGFASVFTDVVAGLRLTWFDFAEAVLNKWSEVEQGVAGLAAKVFAYKNGLDPDQVAANLADDYARKKSDRADTFKSRRDEIGADLTERHAALDQAKLDARAKLNAAHAKQSKEAADHLAATTAEYAALREDARKLRDAQPAKAKAEVPDAPPTFSAPKQTAPAAGQAELAKGGAAFTHKFYTAVVGRNRDEKAQRVREKQLDAQLTSAGKLTDIAASPLATATVSSFPKGG